MDNGGINRKSIVVQQQPAKARTQQTGSSPATRRKAKNGPANTARNTAVAAAATAAAVYTWHLTSPKPADMLPAEAPSIVSAMHQMANQRVMVGTYDPVKGEVVYGSPQSVQEINGTVSTDIVVATTKAGEILVGRFVNNEDSVESTFFTYSKSRGDTMSATPGEGFKVAANNIESWGVISQVNGRLGTEGPTGVFQPGKIPDTLAGVKVNTNRDGSISLGFDAASLRIAPDAKIYLDRKSVV